MSQFTVETGCGVEKDFETRANAENGKDTHQSLCERCANGDIQIHSDTRENGSQEPEVVENSEPVQEENYNLPDDPPVGTDPLTWIPDEFQDTIDGTVAINRKGFEVLAHHYNISCETDMVERTDEIVIHKAEARTEQGTVYTAYGEAHSSEDTEHQLVRMSDTRAFKRAVSRATGIGMVAVSELKSEL